MSRTPGHPLSKRGGNLPRWSFTEGIELMRMCPAVYAAVRLYVEGDEVEDDPGRLVASLRAVADINLAEVSETMGDIADGKVDRDEARRLLAIHDRQEEARRILRRSLEQIAEGGR